MIRLTEPHYGDEERRAVEAVMESTMLTPGEKVREFEDKWAGYVGTEFAVAVNSGTLALIVALHAMKRIHEQINAPSAEWVIVPSFTCSPTVAAVINAGLRPAFVDADETWGMCPVALNDALSTLGNRNVLAVLPVHVYGKPFSLGVFEVAEHHGVQVLEDACEAHGAEYPRDGKVGSVGAAGAFSFRGDKMITTMGVGGAVTTDDALLAEEMAKARDLYLSDGARKYATAFAAGWGAQMSEAQAAFGIEQIDRLPGIIADRRFIARAYGHELTDGEVCWRVPMRVPRPDHAVKIAAEAGVEMVKVFSPLHEQPIGESYPWFATTDLATTLDRQAVCVPVHSGMSNTDVEEVLGCLAR